MDLEKLIEAVKLCGSTPKVDQCKQCAYWAGGDMSRCIPNMTGDAATELSTLQAEVEFWKYRCNESVSHASELDMALYDTEAENEKLRAELEQVKQERDAAVGDMEALMWYSGEGCQICANAVKVHKRPYVRLDCKLGSGIDCKPKWRGKKED